MTYPRWWQVTFILVRHCIHAYIIVYSDDHMLSLKKRLFNRCKGQTLHFDENIGHTPSWIDIWVNKGRVKGLLCVFASCYIWEILRWQKWIGFNITGFWIRNIIAYKTYKERHHFTVSEWYKEFAHFLP